MDLQIIQRDLFKVRLLLGSSIRMGVRWFSSVDVVVVAVAAPVLGTGTGTGPDPEGGGPSKRLLGLCLHLVVEPSTFFLSGKTGWIVFLPLLSESVFVFLIL